MLELIQSQHETNQNLLLLIQQNQEILEMAVGGELDDDQPPSVDMAGRPL